MKRFLKRPNQKKLILDISVLIQEKQALKLYNKQACNKINNLEGRLLDLTVQNKNLKDQLWQKDERDKVLISLMASILKKYGIPPNELSCILHESSKETTVREPENNNQYIKSTGTRYYREAH